MTLNLQSWQTTLPVLCIGMVGIFLVIGAVVLSVYALNRATKR